MKIIRAVVDKFPKGHFDCWFCVPMVDVDSGDEHAYCNLVDEDIYDAVCPLELQDGTPAEPVVNAWKQGHNL